MGRVFLARCSDDKPILVWKHIPLHTPAIRQSAECEAAIYDGPLHPLQGTVVSYFYGSFINEAEDLIVSLMEYVGPSLQGCRP